MNRSIVGRHCELTENTREYINKTLDGLKKYNLDIISARVVISNNERNGKKNYVAEFVINLKGKNTVVIDQKADELYGAIDLGIDRIKKSLRRYSDKIKDHKNVSIKELGSEAEAVSEVINNENADPEIVPMGLDLYKPMDFDEVIDLLKADTKQQFYVFNDSEGNMRVMYKRADGNFGLY